MTDRVEYLSQASEDAHVVFLDYSRKRKGYFFPIFIIEGKDDPKFYSGCLGAYFGENWDLISAGGKSKVLEVRTMIRENQTYQDDIVAFFVDRDFDNLSGEHDLYVTPKYSIENLYCDVNTFQKILTGECGLSNGKLQQRDQIKLRLCNEFTRLNSQYLENLTLNTFNAMYLFSKSIPGERIAADDILKIDVEIKQGNVVVKRTRRKHYAQLVKRRTEISEFLRGSTLWKSVISDKAAYFRGKQQMIFFRAAVFNLRKDGHFPSIIKKEFGVDIKLENPSMADHLLSTSAQYVASPNCLREFLRSFESYVKTKIISTS